MIKGILFSILFFFSLSLSAQFAPPAGMPGSTAIYKDSSAFVTWASSCVIIRGFVNISDTNYYYWINPDIGSNHAYFGVPEDATGKADDTLVVSLGDGGSATLSFNGLIFNGTGNDFAVFENGLSDLFLELGFVEVSSDGINFFRFPSTSLTNPAVQVPTFGTLDATKIDNLAGKYRFRYGTPFDLDTLKNIQGLDINKISHIRVIDVIGCIQPQYATYDSHGNPVNDLWPTPFNTGGFDLDAVGVINFIPQGVSQDESQAGISLSPNPASVYVTISTGNNLKFDVSFMSIDGVSIWKHSNLLNQARINVSVMPTGIYMLSFFFEDGKTSTKKFIKIN